MKAIIASSVVCTENNSTTNNNASNKITKTKHHQNKDIENEEIQMYLSKLKDLVPFMPKNKKLSKLEVIQHVIDYICDLQCALETHPSSSALNGFEAAQTVQLNNNNNNNNQKKTQNSIICPRQPLGVRQSPNTILTQCETPSIILQNLTTAEALTPSDRISIS